MLDHTTTLSDPFITFVMTMDATVESGRDPGGNTGSSNKTPKRSFDVAFLTGVSETREDVADVKDNVSDSGNNKLLQQNSSAKSAFKKVSKNNGLNFGGGAGGSGGGVGGGGMVEAGSGPVDLTTLPTYHHGNGNPFASFPAIATTLSLQLLQQNTAKGLAMSLFSHPAAAAAAVMAAHQQSLFTQPGKSSANSLPRGTSSYRNRSQCRSINHILIDLILNGLFRRRISTTLWPARIPAAAVPPSQNVCARCSLTFRMTSDLVYHMRSQHRRDASNSGSGVGGGGGGGGGGNGGINDSVRQKRQEKLRCPVCGENFRERHHLTRHMTSHEDREPKAAVGNSLRARYSEALQSLPRICGQSRAQYVDDFRFSEHTHSSCAVQQQQQGTLE
nr:EOG090X0POW [Eurycercus lamellatus]